MGQRGIWRTAAVTLLLILIMFSVHYSHYRWPDRVDYSAAPVAAGLELAPVIQSLELEPGVIDLNAIDIDPESAEPDGVSSDDIAHNEEESDMDDKVEAVYSYLQHSQRNRRRRQGSASTRSRRPKLPLSGFRRLNG